MAGKTMYGGGSYVGNLHKKEKVFILSARVLVIKTQRIT